MTIPEAPLARKRLLILTFSPIASDARVLKQVELFRHEYDVTTCAIGEFSVDGVDHVRIPDGLPARDLDGRLITLRQYRAAYWRIGAVAWSRRALTRPPFDAVLANDVEAVGVALSLRPRFGVHADLHEYTPATPRGEPGRGSGGSSRSGSGPAAATCRAPDRGLPSARASRARTSANSVSRRNSSSMRRRSPTSRRAPSMIRSSSCTVAPACVRET